MDGPSAALERLEDGMKIHGREPWRVDRGESGRYPGGPAEGDAEMREVPTRAHSRQEGVLGRIVDIAGAGDVG